MIRTQLSAFSPSEHSRQAAHRLISRILQSPKVPLSPIPVIATAQKTLFLPLLKHCNFFFFNLGLNGIMLSFPPDFFLSICLHESFLL